MAETAEVVHDEMTAASPSTRLLDLLAGWSAFVSESEENGIVDPGLSAEDVGALYQEAGGLMDLGGAEELLGVVKFVTLKVIPSLLRIPEEVLPESREPQLMPRRGSKLRLTKVG